MSKIRTLLITLIGILQKLGFTNKTYSFFRQLSANKLQRKGHLLLNPTSKQVSDIYHSVLKKARVFQWSIIDNTKTFKSEWEKRPLEIIDTIIVGATDKGNWNSFEMYDLFDQTVDNDVTRGKPLPGIAYHLFINASGVIEKVADYRDLIWHTKGVNTRAIGVVIQYSVTNNSAAPLGKVMNSLIKTLCILCLRFKLNPYKAIRGQSEIQFNMIPLLKGHTNIQDVSPGTLISMDEVRRQVVIQMKRKLKYAGSYDGEINDKLDLKTIHAINDFTSEALDLLEIHQKPITLNNFKADTNED